MNLPYNFNNMTRRELFNILTDLVYSSGNHKPMKYGEWIKAPYTKNIYFTLTTPGNDLSIKRGNGSYRKNTGFGFDDEEIYIGNHESILQPKALLLFWAENYYKKVTERRMR